jgi:acetolactate decarboxylase
MGTLNGLDGEMIALNGVFYQVPSTGIPRQVNSDELTPYATVTFFETTQTLQITTPTTYQQLTATINQSLPNHDVIYAIKVHGTYNSATTRSPQIQQPPYPNLTHALLTQSIFNLSNVEGTIVGFYFPNSMSGVDYAGYHLHFLTDDLTAGGHLLNCTISNATIELCEINTYTLVIP